MGSCSGKGRIRRSKKENIKNQNDGKNIENDKYGQRELVYHLTQVSDGWFYNLLQSIPVGLFDSNKAANECSSPDGARHYTQILIERHRHMRMRREPAGKRNSTQAV